jgi:hypothetical protein
MFVSSALAGAMASFLPVSVRAETTESDTAQAPAQGQWVGDASIRPFHFHASDKALADLRRRISATRWPSRELVGDATQGVQLATMQKLALLVDPLQLAQS